MSESTVVLLCNGSITLVGRYATGTQRLPSYRSNVFRPCPWRSVDDYQVSYDPVQRGRLGWAPIHVIIPPVSGCSSSSSSASSLAAAFFALVFSRNHMGSVSGALNLNAVASSAFSYQASFVSAWIFSRISSSFSKISYCVRCPDTAVMALLKLHEYQPSACRLFALLLLSRRPTPVLCSLVLSSKIATVSLLELNANRMNVLLYARPDPTKTCMGLSAAVTWE